MDARRLDNLRAWWVWRKEVVGLVLATIALACIALVANPFAAVSNTEGKVVEFLKLGRKGSVETYAVIRVDGQQRTIRLDATPECYVGKTVFIQKRRAIIGTQYSAPRGCY